MGTTFEAIGLADANPASRDAAAVIAPSGVRVLGSRVARWIVAAAAIGLTALSIALAAPASAHGSHGGGEVRHHLTATSAVQAQPDGAGRSPLPSGNTANAAVDPPTGNPPTGSVPEVRPGHDKCKALKGGLPGPPWCNDPSAGWMQSTLNRTDASFPTLPGAEAAADRGRAAAGRGAATTQAAIGQPRP